MEIHITKAPLHFPPAPNLAPRAIYIPPLIYSPPLYLQNENDSSK